MLLRRRINLLCALVLLVTTAVTSPATPARAASASSSDAVLNWNAIARRVTVTVALLSPAHSLVYMSYAQAAVYNAVVAIEGRYRPYNSHLGRRPGASVDAAVAAAAYDVLVHYFPGQQAALDADYATSLAAITDGQAKTRGIELGQAAAAELIALRQGDGLEANIGFVMPTPGPGVFELPAGVNALTPWLSQMRPFLLARPDQFRPGPPPALTSRQYTLDYAEVQSVGRVDSTVRTAEQTDVARFWTTQAGMQYNVAFAALATAKGLDAVDAARLFAMGNLVGADATIACWDAKYHYLYWRPLFAITQGETDGNPRTTGEAGWTGLAPSPPHPEYPSGHGCLTAAEAEVFASFLGTQQIEIDLTSTVTGLTHSTRHFATVTDLVTEIVNARVWAGIHYRSSDLTGVTIGRQVAQWTLRRNFQGAP